MTEIRHSLVMLAGGIGKTNQKLMSPVNVITEGNVILDQPASMNTDVHIAQNLDMVYWSAVN